MDRNKVTRYLPGTSNSQQFQQAPPTKGIFPQEFQAKSLFRNILPINPLDRIFCAESLLAGFCFQYFANKRGRGSPGTNSLTDPQNGESLGRRILLTLGSMPLAYINLLCPTGTLVYGCEFAKTQGRVWPPDRIFETDGPFQYSGRERNSLAESLFAASGFGSPTRPGELLRSLAAQHVGEGPEPSTSEHATVLKRSPIRHSSMCSPQARNSIGKARHLAVNLHM